MSLHGFSKSAMYNNIDLKCYRLINNSWPTTKKYKFTYRSMSKVKFKVIHQVSPSFMWELNCIQILIGKKVFCDSRLSICEYKIWHKNTQVVSCVLYTNNNGENRLRNWIFISLSYWYFLTKEHTNTKLTSSWNNA